MRCILLALLGGRQLMRKHLLCPRRIIRQPPERARQPVRRAGICKDPDQPGKEQPGGIGKAPLPPWSHPPVRHFRAVQQVPQDLRIGRSGKPRLL